MNSGATRHTPNHISLETRVWYLVISSLIVTYTAASLWVDDFFIWIPAGRRGNFSVHLHGLPAWIAGTAMACAVANLLSVVVDHYDKRNNETNYRLFAKVTFLTGCCLFTLALFLHPVMSSVATQPAKGGRVAPATLQLVLGVLGSVGGVAYGALGFVARKWIHEPTDADRVMGWSLLWSLERSRYSVVGQRLCTQGTILFVVSAACWVGWVLLRPGR